MRVGIRRLEAGAGGARHPTPLRDRYVPAVRLYVEVLAVHDGRATGDVDEAESVSEFARDRYRQGARHEIHVDENLRRSAGSKNP